MQVDPEHVSRVLSLPRFFSKYIFPQIYIYSFLLPRMARLHTLGLHHQREDFRVVTNQSTPRYFVNANVTNLNVNVNANVINFLQVSLGPEEGAPSYRIYRVRRVGNEHVEPIIRSAVKVRK